MDRHTIELRIAGQSYRIVSSAPEQDLKRLAEMVNTKLAEVTPRGRPIQAQAILLAAMALAHELETERDLREALERRARDVLRKALNHIDAILEPVTPAPDAAANKR